MIVFIKNYLTAIFLIVFFAPSCARLKVGHVTVKQACIALDNAHELRFEGIRDFGSIGILVFSKFEPIAIVFPLPNTLNSLPPPIQQATFTTEARVTKRGWDVYDTSVNADIIYSKLEAAMSRCVVNGELGAAGVALKIIQGESPWVLRTVEGTDDKGKWMLSPGISDRALEDYEIWKKSQKNWGHLQFLEIK